MKKDLFKRMLILFSILLLPSLINAQGVIRGTILDSLSNEKLIGATVSVVGTSLGAVTDVEGDYKIVNIPLGKHQLKVTYIGYKQKFIPVDLTDGQPKRINIKIVIDAVNIHEIVVTGQARGQVAAINQQLGANTIVNVISEEKIQELPDQNAAEAIGRLPGVSITRSGGEANKVVLRGLSDKFSVITIDGVRLSPTDANSRGFDLSSISQGSLAGIELFKALTSDKDADAIAGSVNLVTKKAPETRQLRFDLKGGYNKMNNSSDQYDLSFKYGERFFDDILGVQLTGNLEKKFRSREYIDYNWNLGLNSGKDYEISDFTVGYTDEIRKRGGLSFLLDINTPDSGSIRISNVYNSTNRNYIDYTRNYPMTATTLLYTARDREQDIKTYTSSIRGDNNLFGLGINWGLSFSQSKSETPYDFYVDFQEPSALENGVVISGMGNVPDAYSKGPADKIIDYALNNYSKAFLNLSYIRGLRNLDIEKAAFLDITGKYNIDNYFTGEFKAGGKYRYKTRSKVSSELVCPYYIYSVAPYVRLDDGTIVPKSFVGTMFENMAVNGSRVLSTNFLNNPVRSRNVYDNFFLNPILNREAVREWYNLNHNGYNYANGTSPEYSRNNEEDANYYDIVERVSAAYAMNTLHIGQDLTLITGIRVETEDNDYKSRYAPKGLSGFPTPVGTIRDTSATHTETIWLPNLQIIIKPTDYLTVRMAAYKAISRPDFNYRLENYIPRNNGTLYSGNSLTIGNPGLKAAKAWNFELNTSVYNNTIGLISISAFFKYIDDMYHQMSGNTLSGSAVLDTLGIAYRSPFTGEYGLIYPYNSKKPTKVWGFEIEQQTNLNFLPGLLSHFVLSYNISVIRSETYIMTSKSEVYTVYIGGIPIQKSRWVSYEQKQKLEGQPELFGNIALGYDIGGFSARVSIFYQDEYNSFFSATQRSDQVRNKFSRWDLAIKQDVTPNFTLLFNLNNFTNSEEGNSIVNRIENWKLPNTSEKFGLNADLGLRITL